MRKKSKWTDGYIIIRIGCFLGLFLLATAIGALGAIMHFSASMENDLSPGNEPWYIEVLAIVWTFVGSTFLFILSGYTYFLSVHYPFCRMNRKGVR